MTQLRAALVGCGSVSQRGALPHLTCEDAKAAVHLAAVVDVVPERAAQTASRFGVPAWYADVDEMLASTDVDIVLVITPIQHHFANALAAIEAGKHVYVQKTMTATVEEADRLIAARDRAGVHLVAAPGFDLFPTTHAIRAVVESGEVGKIGFGYTYAWGFGHEHEAVRSGDDALSAINPMWYFRRGAGPLPDVTVYSLQLATSVLGSVRRVTALGNKLIPTRQWRDESIEIEVDDNVVVVMEFASGAIVTAVGSDTAASKRNDWGALGLYGTHGGIEVFGVDPATGYPLSFEVYGGGGWGTFGASVRERTERTALTSHPRLAGPHLEIEEAHLYVDIMELVDAVRDGRPAGATAEQARHVVEIIECAHCAIETGSTQELRTTVAG
jgi:predicted dehydrogenase